MKRVDVKTRFFQKTIINNGDDCWPWLSYKTPSGYGHFRFKGKEVGAHRVSWEIHYGEIPDGKHVLHKCDNRECVNPNHLFLGTHQDNMRDKREKGRCSSLPGEKNPKAKLTKEQVKTIRHLYFAEQIKTADIAQFFNVCKSTITRICANKLWSFN